MKLPIASRRGRDINEQHRASTPLELLFDLTFVVAIASAASQLHHGIIAHHAAQAVPGYLLAFTSIWWAWMNYTWFASAYDNDDTLFRVLTMVQMGGVLLFATGIPGIFTGQFFAAVIGYIVMRIALVVQWIRAALGDPPRRQTCLRYASGIVSVQLGWVVFILAVQNGILSGFTLVAAILLLWLCELLVPIWAEHAGTTPWHAHHIAERYGLMVIIVLGECVLGAANTIANVLQAQGWSFDLALVGFAGVLLIFALWWMYFLLPSAEALHHHRGRVWVWGYGHFFLFAAIAAVGVGLEVVADALKTVQTSTASDAAHAIAPLAAISTVAIAEALFVMSLNGLHLGVVRSSNKQIRLSLFCLLCIAIGPAAVFLGLPLPWGLLLLSFGPLCTIAYYERGRRHCTEHFAIR